MVTLDNISFDQIVKLWHKARDRDDHDVLGAILLNTEALKKAIVGPCPGETVLRYSDHGLGRKCKKHPWHPTSQARIACCLWMLEKGLL